MYVRVASAFAAIDAEVLAIVVRKFGTKDRRGRLAKATSKGSIRVSCRCTVTVIRSASIVLGNLYTRPSVEAVGNTTAFAFHLASFSVVFIGTDAVLEILVGLKDGITGILDTHLALASIEAVQIAVGHNTIFEFAVWSSQTGGTVAGKLQILNKILLTGTPIHAKGIVSTGDVVTQNGIDWIFWDADDCRCMV
jgi:hypothetical protein